MSSPPLTKAPSVHSTLPTTEPTTETTPRKWYHSSLFNAFVIGGVGFLAPGLWNAMNDLGAGGALDPFLVNAANALVFGIMGLLCLFGAPISNRIGLANTLTLGAVGYPVYSAGLYCNNKFGNTWFVLVGAVLCGASAGLFWVSEGAVALGYPEPSKRGKYMNIWLWFRTGGPLLGGAIVLALNNSAEAKKKGKVSTNTYLIFIALQCLACPLALALSPPHKVQRADGTKVTMNVSPTFRAELRALYRVSTRRDILLLLPVFYATMFNQYAGNFKTYYFGVRARALIGLVSNVGTLASSQLISSLLDYSRWSVIKRIKISFFYVVALHLLAWAYAWAIQERLTASPLVMDWSDPGFTRTFFVLLLWDFSRQALQNWLYYLVASMTDDVAQLSRFAGVLRGQEAFGQAVAFGINTRKWTGGRVPLGVNTVLLVLSAWPTWCVVRKHVPVEGAGEVVEETGANGEEEVVVVGKEKMGVDVVG